MIEDIKILEEIFNIKDEDKYYYWKDKNIRRENSITINYELWSKYDDHIQNHPLVLEYLKLKERKEKLEALI